MSFTMPTINECCKSVENGFSKAFSGSSSALRVSVFKVLSKVIGGSIYTILLAVQYIWKEFFVETASVAGLLRKGADLCIPHKPVGFAHGSVTFYGPYGSHVPEGAIIENAKNGKQYRTLSSAYISGYSSVSVNVVAVDPGEDSNLDVSVGETESFTAVEGLSGFTAITLFSPGLVGGRVVKVNVNGNEEEWGETVEEYRSRIRERIQNPDHEGAGADYKVWLKKQPGIGEAYIFPNWPTTNGVGCFVADYSNSSCIVSSVDVANARVGLESNMRRGITSRPFIASVTAVSVSLKVTTSNISEGVKNAVKNALAGYFKTVAPGTTVFSSNIADVVKSSCGDASAVITDVAFNNVKSEIFTLAKNYTNSAISGQVMNPNNIAITWEASA